MNVMGPCQTGKHSQADREDKKPSSCNTRQCVTINARVFQETQALEDEQTWVGGKNFQPGDIVNKDTGVEEHRLVAEFSPVGCSFIQGSHRW